MIPLPAPSDNTGQILLGLAAGVALFGNEYADTMHRAASWLRDTLDDDGAWRRFSTPFAAPGEKAYETHVAWGLMAADAIAPGHGYLDAATANVRWALSKQRDNGWFADCCLSTPETPLTHTIGYVLRGVVEGWRYSRRREFLDSAKACADGLLPAIGPNGLLAGQLDSQWRPAADWVCLTGSSQIAHCLFLLYQDLPDSEYLAAARKLNQFVRRTIKIDGSSATRGAVKGSFPVSGAYGQYEYLNWATKFTIDSNMMESSMVKSPSPETD